MTLHSLCSISLSDSHLLCLKTLFVAATSSQYFSKYPSVLRICIVTAIKTPRPRVFCTLIFVKQKVPRTYA